MTHLLIKRRRELIGGALCATLLMALGLELAYLRSWQPHVLTRFKNEEQEVVALAWTPDGQRLTVVRTASFYPLGDVSSWRITDAQKLWYKFSGPLLADLQNDGHILILSDKGLEVLNDEGKEVEGESSFGLSSPPWGFACATATKWFAQCDKRGFITVRRLGERTSARHLGAKGECKDVLALSPEGGLLATNSYIHKHNEWHYVVNLWDVKTGGLLHSLPSFKEGVEGLAFSHNGQMLAANAGGEIVVRSVSNGQIQWKVTLGQTIVIGFSPDGRYLAAGSFAALRLYNAKTGVLERILKPSQEALDSVPTHALPGEGGRNGDLQNVLAFAFSPDGSTLAMGKGSIITLWRMK